MLALHSSTIAHLQVGYRQGQKQEFGKNQPKHSVRINCLYGFYNIVLYMLLFVNCNYFYSQKDLLAHLFWGGPQSLALEECTVQLRNVNTPKYLIQCVKYSNRGIQSEMSTHQKWLFFLGGDGGRRMHILICETAHLIVIKASLHYSLS